MSGRTSLARGGVALLLVWAQAARAQGPAHDRAGDHDVPAALAEALFRNGRELMAAGRYAEACPKFAESQRVDPKPGTVLNLALCHEKTGRTASAWAEYVDAAEVAHAAGEADREKVAHAHAEALEPRLAHVIVDAAAPGDARVSLDERVVGAGAFGTPIPVDPGEHVLRATAPRKKPFSRSFTVPAGASTQMLHIPALDDERAEASGRTGSKVPPAAASRAPWLANIDRRTWGFVAGGAGVALLGVGAFFGVQAFAEKHSADSECDAARCTQAGLDAIHAMKTAEATSTLTIVAGVAGLGAGLYLVLAPRPRSDASTTWRVGPDAIARGVRVRVDW